MRGLLREKETVVFFLLSRNAPDSENHHLRQLPSWTRQLSDCHWAAAVPPTPMVTVSAANRGSEPETISLVDMSKLTQSELQTLSLRCSTSSPLCSKLTSSDHPFLPKIDRSVFNESAGFRRQTYSLPDRSFSSSSVPAAGYHHRNRVAGLMPVPKLASLPLDDDPERRENITIIRTLKHYISQNPSSSFAHIDLIPPSLPAPVGFISDSLASLGGERKRKRGRKPKPKMNLNVEQNITFEIPQAGTLELKNKNGVPIDVDALAALEDPYAEELRKRTLGLHREEELLAFLRDLGGEWGSRRKRRKIVDAGIFGDILPVGWKLLLGLRRRERHASVFCRRYVRLVFEFLLALLVVISSGVYAVTHGLKLVCSPNGNKDKDSIFGNFCKIPAAAAALCPLC